MKYILNTKEMKQCDSRTIEYYGIPSMVLMERAALAVVSFLREKDFLDKKIGILCGRGNNGGDGLAVARLLYLEGAKVLVYLEKDDTKASMENKQQENICRQYQIPLQDGIDGLEDCDVILDAIFGIGLTREITGVYRQWIETANEGDAYRIAIDMPSGISADDGQVFGTAFQADATLTFGFAKVGQMIYPGKKYCGTTRVCAIGIEECSLTDQILPCRMMDKEDLSLLPEREPDANKGSHGKVLLIAGSEEMAGAAYLAAYASMIAGAGMVRIYTHKCNRDVILSRFPEAILVCYEKWNEKQLLEQLSWADVIAIGPGIGQGSLSENMVKTTLDNAAVPVVADADALNILAKHITWLKRPHTDLIVTPHLGEMARLIGSPMMYVKEHKLSVAAEFAREYQVICVLKDAASVIGIPYGTTYINGSGCKGMATAGSGDVLTGVIASLVSQKVHPETAAALGVYLHGLAGEIAAEKQGMTSMVASDIIEGIRKIFRKEGK